VRSVASKSRLVAAYDASENMREVVDEEGQVWNWGDIEQRLGQLQHSLRTPPPPPTARRALLTPPSRGGSYAKKHAAAAAAVASAPPHVEPQHKEPLGSNRVRQGTSARVAASPAALRAGKWSAK
jgi:hypothetical protein